MIGIQYEGEYLDILPDTSLQWEENNLLFSSADSTRLQGSYTFPFTIPATDHNRTLLNYPDRLDNAWPLLTTGPAVISYQGTALFQGTLRVVEATATRIKVSIIANPLYSLKESKLNELDLGGDRTFERDADVIDHALSTAEDPLDYDYIFFPIYNPAFLTTPSANPRGRFQNWFDSTNQAFSAGHDHPALMPFIRLEYLLQQIFAGQDYTFVNEFQTTPELRLLCLYNNWSIWRNGISLTINLQNHVSNTPAPALLRKLMGAFCLALSYDPWARTLRLTPVRRILAAPPRHDWTSRILYTPVITSSAEQPEVICWRRDDSDGAWAHYDQYLKPANVDDAITNEELVTTAPAGTYYIIDRHSWYTKTSFPRYFFKHTNLGCAPLDAGRPAFEAELQPLWDVYLYGEGYTPVTDGNYVNTPHCRIPGDVEYESPDEQPVNQKADVPDRLLLYRGMYPDFDGQNYPLASTLPYDTESNAIGEISLRWNSQDYNMYDTWWRQWHTMLRQGKNVTASLRLSVADLLNFRMDHKVRIQNQEYLVRRLRITLTQRGLAPIEAELVSTL